MASASDDRTDLVGQTIGGKYLLTRVLGAGGMGTVYEATNAWTQRRVAVKLMLARHAESAEQVERFLREARAAGRIDHPNVVQVLDVGRQSDGAFYLVQEFLAGRDLRSLLAEERQLSPRRARELLGPVMSGLAAAHASDVIHRDIKPDNIFIARVATGEVVPKVIDFGIAKLSEGGPESASVTRTGTTLGTALYMSPEQAAGERDLDASTDIWSIGVVLFECLVGFCPFEGGSYNAVLARILTKRPPHLDQVLPGVPADVAEVVAGALAGDRARRYRTMEQLLAALRAAPGFDDQRVLRPAVRGPCETVAGWSPPGAKAPVVGEPNTADERPRGARDLPAPNPLADTLAAIPTAEAVAPLLAAAVAEAPASLQPAREESRGARPRAPRPLWIGAGLLATIAVVVVGIQVRGRRETPSETSAIAALPSTVPRPLPVATVAAGSREFSVALSIDPATARVELDGASVGVGAFPRTFPRDGTAHALRVSAPGFLPQTVPFVDAPPPDRIVLVRAAHAVGSGGPEATAPGGKRAPSEREQRTGSGMNREYE